MMFIDQATIRVKAGDGGHGCVAFRREKFVPKGGPSGGDGGTGGSVWIVASKRLNTLYHLQFQREWKGGRGEHGMGSKCSGHDGNDVTIELPVGSVVRDKQSGEIIADLTHDGERVLIAKGGRGGWGNQHFATATRQAPRFAQDGGEGEERELFIELKLIADVGLVGQPNAGKSTLLSVISAARPKIADYPFTTLSPNLGVTQLSDHRTFVVADIPGIIEGAHEGRGLGLQFLRHIERTRILAFLIPVDSMDWQAEYDTLRREVRSYSEELARKPHAVVFTKMDLMGDLDVPPLEASEAFATFAISAANRDGLDELKAGLWARLLDLRKEQSRRAAEAPLP